LHLAFAFMAQEQIKTGDDDEAVASSISEGMPRKL
jgi:hypothetical protein